MVRSKEVHKKPKDRLMTPPPPSSSAKLRRFHDDDGSGSRPRNRGGVAMSPAPAASVPNYMRGTSSSDAKVGRRPLSSASSPPRRRPVRVVTRGKVLFPKVAAAAGLGRATCSSTMKEAKFPDALDLAPGATDAEGPAATRVCPYTYCSLNGHAHSPAVPLRSFLASRRRLIKTQQSMKLKGVSAFRKNAGHQRPEDSNGGGGGARVAPLIDEEALGDFFVEVYAGPRVSTDMSCSDMSLDEMDATVRKMEFVVFDRCGADESDEKGKNNLDICGDGDARMEERFGAFRDNTSECSDASTSGEFVEELPWIRYQGYEDDSLDDEFSDEHGIRDEEITGAVVSEFQEDQEEEGTSGRLGDGCQDEAAQEQEENDEQNISDFARESEIAAEHEGVDFRVEACEEQERVSEDNILDAAHQTEVCREQEMQEEKNFAAVCKLGIRELEVAETADNVPDETCKEETSMEQEEGGDGTDMESESISEVAEQPNVEDEENMQDDGGSEMEISEEIISGLGCEEDFSEEVTSKDVSEGEISDSGAIVSLHVEMQKQPVENHALEQDDSSTADNAFHQDDSTVDRAFDQDDTTADGHDNSQKELNIGMGEFRVNSEEAGIQEANHDDPVDCTEEVHKDSDISLCDLQDASEGSGITEESSHEVKSTCLNDGAQMVPDITTQTLEDASEESDTAQETTLDDNSTPLAACAQMELGIGTSELIEGSSDVTEESGIAEEISQDDNAEYFTDDDSQKATMITTCQLQVDSKENVIAQEADDNSTGVRDDAQNEPEETCELPTSEECRFTQETIQNHGALEESVVIASASEDAHEEIDPTQDGHEEDYSVGINAGAQKEGELDTSESGGVSEGTTVHQEDDGHVNTTDLNGSAKKEITVSIFDDSEELCSSEENNQSSNMLIPEFSDNFTAEEPQNKDTVAKESSLDDICNAFSGMHLKGDVYLDPTESMTCPGNRLIIARRRRTPEEEEYLRGFNPRAPNFLPLELDPESEKVDLKHQMMDERKNAEEWMIDYALRRAVNNLGPARKKKVELLVQAFETVLPHDEEEKKDITPTRPVQACN
uniref:Calmodulin-binding domain-containing protein n=1 Tax=Oryza punctata TaxID=4537 RepID=A0A0E0L1X8_ORYPU